MAQGNKRMEDMMAQTKRIIVSAMVIFFLNVHCLYAQNGAAVVVFGLDETGSYNLRHKGIEIAQTVIGSLKGGDVFYARRITDKSFSDSASIFRLSIPDTGNQPANKFDRKAYSEWQKKVKQASLVKSQAVDILRNMKPVKATGTDIWGFFAAATARFQAEGQEYKKRTIIISTDMKDNMNRKAAIDLFGANVIIVGFQSGENACENQNLQAAWQAALKKVNAGSISFLPADSKFTFRR